MALYSFYLFILVVLTKMRIVHRASNPSVLKFCFFRAVPPDLYGIENLDDNLR